MGFQKNWMVSGWGELYPSLFWIFVTLQSPLLRLLLFAYINVCSATVAAFCDINGHFLPGET